jgi:hypothetical protein
LSTTALLASLLFFGLVHPRKGADYDQSQANPEYIVTKVLNAFFV